LWMAFNYSLVNVSVFRLQGKHVSQIKVKCGVEKLAKFMFTPNFTLIGYAAPEIINLWNILSL